MTKVVAKEIVAEAITILVLFSCKSVWSSFFATSLSIILFCDGETSKEASDESSVVTKVVDVSICHGAHIKINSNQQKGKEGDVYPLPRHGSSHVLPICKNVRHKKANDSKY